MAIFNREKKKIERMIQRLQNHATEFSDILRKIERIGGVEGFEGIEPFYDYLRNRSCDLFVMPGDDLLKYLDSSSENSEERDSIINKYPKDKIEELNNVSIFTLIFGGYLLTVIEHLPLKTQIKMLKVMIKDRITEDIMALSFSLPKIDEDKFLSLEDLFKKMVETKRFAGLMLFILLGENKKKKVFISLKTQYKLLKSIRKNDFELFEEVIEQSDERLADSLSIIYANLYPVAVALESTISSRDIPIDEMQEYLSLNGIEWFTSDSPSSKVFGLFIGVSYAYLEFLWGAFPNEAKGIDHFFEINDLWDFMDLYSEWCYQETEQLIDARNDVRKRREQTTSSSTELDDTNNEEGSSLNSNTDAEQIEDNQSPTSGDEKKTREKNTNYHISVDQKPEVIKMLVEGLVRGYTTEEYGTIPSLVTTEKLYDDYDDIEELLTFFFTGDRSNFTRKIPYKLIWKVKVFYLYFLMQLIFNEKEFKEASEVINTEEDTSKSLISDAHVKADFRGKNIWKEIEVVFGIKPNTIKNSTPTIGQANEDTKHMMEKLAQFWLDCKKTGKN